MKEVLNALLRLSDEAFDPVAKKELRELLKDDAPDEVMRTGLHHLLDMCVNGALGAGLVIKTLDIAWKHYGGKHDDPTPWRTP